MFLFSGQSCQDICTMMLSYKKIIIISACCFVLTIIFGFAAYQSIFEFIIKNQVSLHQKNYVRQFYLKYPIALDFRVYFFNVTNPAEVHKGAIPILKEVGPYCYDLYKERIDVVDDENEDSLTYSPHDTYLFNEERSQGLKPDDYVTIIHPLIVGMVNYVATKSPHLLAFLNTALSEMFPDNTDIYLTAQVKDILFDGMLINCTTNDFSALAVCARIKKHVPGLKLVGKHDVKYALLGDKNGTEPIRVKVLRGIKESKDLGRLVAVNNETQDTVWSKDECNKFRGTDGWIFPPLSGHLDQIWIHPTVLCTNLHADYVEDTFSHNIKVRKFLSDFDGLCRSCSLANETCPPQGLIDLTKCVNVPVYISLPHFLRSDENLLKNVVGLEPDIQKHITRILLEETLSLPLEAQIRLQFNFPIQPLNAIDIMQTVPKIIHPMLWMEMGVDLNGWFLTLIKFCLYSITTVEVFKYISLITSLVGMGFGSYMYCKNKKIYKANDNIVLHHK